MKIEISVPEIAHICNEIQKKPGKILQMVKTDIRQAVQSYLDEIMSMELTSFLGRDRYKRVEGEANHRNGTYGRRFTLKGIGELLVNIPRDRQGDYRTGVIPRSKRYEDELRQDIVLMFMGGMSTRTLSMVSTKLLGRRISPAEVSRAGKELIDAVEA